MQSYVPFLIALLQHPVSLGDVRSSEAGPPDQLTVEITAVCGSRPTKLSYSNSKSGRSIVTIVSVNGVQKARQTAEANKAVGERYIENAHFLGCLPGKAGATRWTLDLTPSKRRRADMLTETVALIVY